MGDEVSGYGGMSWDSWAGSTAGLVWDWKAVRQYFISVFSSLLFLPCIFFLIVSGIGAFLSVFPCLLFSMATP